MNESKKKRKKTKCGSENAPKKHTPNKMDMISITKHY